MLPKKYRKPRLPHSALSWSPLQPRLLARTVYALLTLPDLLLDRSCKPPALSRQLRS